MSNNENVLTKAGKKELEAKLNKLISEDKPKALSELNLARSQGDLSENADYDAARERLQELETQINRISYILDHCKIVETKKNTKRVSLGGEEVTIRDIAKDKTYTFKIVGSAEANPLEGKISNTCPVGQACIGHSVGDEVTVMGPKPYVVLIEKVGD